MATTFKRRQHRKKFVRRETVIHYTPCYCECHRYGRDFCFACTTQPSARPKEPVALAEDEFSYPVVRKPWWFDKYKRLTSVDV